MPHLRPRLIRAAADDLRHLPAEDDEERELLQKRALQLLAAAGRREIRGQECGWRKETGNLMDCRKLYFDSAEDKEPRYRVVYRELPDEESPQEIEVLAIGLKGPYLELSVEYIYTLVGKRLGRVPT